MSKSAFKDRIYVTKYLSDALVKRRLAIFLGAGVSRNLVNSGKARISLPTWPELVQRLYATKGWRLPAGANYAQQVGDFRIRLLDSGKKPSHFQELVSKALYRDVALDFAMVRRNPTLAGIGALVAHSLRGRVSEVFTLNFDDILERYLRFHGIVATPVIREKFWAEPADVLVHHPHGFLPSPGSPFSTNSSFLVFDEQSYVKQTPDSRWNQRMEVAMQSHICLFIGLGRDDTHLKALVAKTAEKHAFSAAKDGFWGVVLRAKARKEEVRDWKQYDVHVENLANYGTDLPNLLFSVCQMAARFP
jgi:hypothetical protein